MDPRKGFQKDTMILKASSVLFLNRKRHDIYLNCSQIADIFIFKKEHSSSCTCCGRNEFHGTWKFVEVSTLMRSRDLTSIFIFLVMNTCCALFASWIMCTLWKVVQRNLALFLHFHFPSQSMFLVSFWWTSPDIFYVLGPSIHTSHNIIIATWSFQNRIR